MDDQSLKEFIPLLGERIALRNFCADSQKSPHHNGNSSKKDTLLDKLRKKLSVKRDPAKCSSNDEDEEGYSGLSGDNRSSRLKGNQNAKRNERKIDVGWIDYDYTTKRYKQVRKQNGGGTRQLSVSKTLRSSELLAVVQRLFFKDNISCKGDLDEFETELCDFRHQSLLDETTVGKLYSETKMPVLRFYLKTKAKVHKDETKANKKRKRILVVSDDSADESADENITDPELPWINISNEVEIPFTMTSVQTSSHLPEIPGTIIDVDDFTQPETPTIMFGPTSSLDTDLNDTIPDEAGTAYEVLLIIRAVIVEDFIQAFSNDSIMKAKIAVHMIMPNGEIEAGQGVGVYKDAITQFWEQFYNQFTTLTGDNFKVPVIRHDYRDTEWQAVGRIIAKGWQDLKYFPVSLAPPF